MSIIITGHKNHGKDTACEIINLPWVGSSRYACNKFIFNQMKEKYKYRDTLKCYEDRNNHRKFWYDSIEDYNAEDRARLGTEIFSNYTIYCGIRSIRELTALRKKFPSLLVVWIDASKRKPLESKESITVTQEDCDIIITNNNSIEDFSRKLINLKNNLYWGHCG